MNDAGDFGIAEWDLNDLSGREEGIKTISQYISGLTKSAIWYHLIKHTIIIAHLRG